MPEWYDRLKRVLSKQTEAPPQSVANQRAMEASTAAQTAENTQVYAPNEKIEKLPHEEFTKPVDTSPTAKAIKELRKPQQTNNAVGVPQIPAAASYQEKNIGTRAGEFNKAFPRAHEFLRKSADNADHASENIGDSPAARALKGEYDKKITDTVVNAKPASPVAQGIMGSVMPSSIVASKAIQALHGKIKEDEERRLQAKLDDAKRRTKVIDAGEVD